MTFKLKSIAAAIVLSAATIAQAAPATVLLPNQAWSFAGLADDYFEFSVAAPGTYSLSITAAAVAAPGAVINELRLYEGPGLSSYVAGIFAPGQFINWNVNFVSAGAYSLYVDVHPNALYSGAIVATSAVPEPETYAMMLAGLGALGFMARRRKAS